jgi:hypothetical protein
MSKKKKKHPKAWTPFERASLNLPTANQLDAYGDMIQKVLKDDEVWLNSHYQVNVRKIKAPEGWPCDMIHLSIKRLNKDAVHDWRHFQWIKNELVGEENEAIEIYPSESRLIDTSNQYHLWVFSDPNVKIPLGFTTRTIWEGNSLGSRQRNFPPEKRPIDCVTLTDANAKEIIRQMQENTNT